MLLATWRALIGAVGAMDAESLLLSLELASGSGQGLSPDRRASLLTSLTLVKRDYRYDRVLFWGRILGLVADYYIAQGLSEDQLAPRKTLYRWRRRPAPEGGATRRPGKGGRGRNRKVVGRPAPGREGTGSGETDPEKGLEGRGRGRHELGRIKGPGPENLAEQRLGARVGAQERNLDVGGFMIQAGPRTEVQQGERSQSMGTWGRRRCRPGERSLEKGREPWRVMRCCLEASPEVSSAEALAHKRRRSRK